MQLIENQSLEKLNTFGLAASAAHFIEAKTETEIRAALKLNLAPLFILGGGSNLLLTKNWPGLVLKNSLRGMTIERRFANHVWVRAGGGEAWHDFVWWTLANGLSGLENLSLIPGTVGAAPIQNIGAYGVEITDTFLKLEAIEISTGRTIIFNKQACKFGYRNSIFKTEKKGQFIISAVWFRLPTTPKLNLKYGAIRETLAQMGIENPSPTDVSNAVITIRKSKLPDPAVIGNSGSFFKNPEIDRPFFEKLKNGWPEIPHFDAPGGLVKIPAGWLIEQCGWKGKRLGQAGCHEKHALVLVNLGGATGAEIWQLAGQIIESVHQKFGIRIEPEVNVI